ncbi:MAG: glycosyltransferase family 4 protein [bacterium]|nr:glycosyltransferase family 4 protein [bacterium]
MERKYISLIAESPHPVIQSQAVEYFSILERNNMIFDMIFLMNGKDYLRKFRELSFEKSNIKQLISGTVSMYPCPGKGSPSGDFLAQCLISYTLRNLPWNTKSAQIIIHARGNAGFYAARLKEKRPHTKYVFDYRGRNTYEYEALQQGIPREIIDKKAAAINARERYIAEHADHITCVSSVLRKNLVEKHAIESGKITVIPCVADKNLFYYDLKSRNNTRKQLNLTDKFVYVFAGGLGRWHYTNELFEIVAALLENQEDAFFLMLTTEDKKAEKLAAEKLPPGRYLVRSEQHRELASYLMAADAGLLLREDDPINREASPTKFAEYILAGLPVIISGGIGDYSQFVREKKTGIVMNPGAPTAEYVNTTRSFRAQKPQPEREKIAALGAGLLSKTVYINRLKEIYETV